MYKIRKSGRRNLEVYKTTVQNGDELYDRYGIAKKKKIIPNPDEDDVNRMPKKRKEKKRNERIVEIINQFLCCVIYFSISLLSVVGFIMVCTKYR